MYDQYMAAANQQYQFLLVGWGARALRWVTLGFCLATLALNLAMYFMER